MTPSTLYEMPSTTSSLTAAWTRYVTPGWTGREILNSIFAVVASGNSFRLRDFGCDLVQARFYATAMDAALREAAPNARSFREADRTQQYPLVKAGPDEPA